ncbi:MAG: cysteine synthase A [Methanomassiliicoccales archaeon]|nr:cysteine synthase A [Methanomassiliicoccales archaeon]
MLHNSITSTIGRTPLVRLNNISIASSAEIYVKLEGRNPGGSIKDRVALHMVEVAEKNGQLKKGMSLVEPTSGNTGIGLALVCAARGYQISLTMPENMSVERINLLRSLGANVILTPASEGMAGAVAKAKELSSSGNYCMPNQFDNPSNPETHYLSTGPEIFRDLPSIDAFVAGIGTGGTITGVGKYLKERKKGVLIVGVEPAGSPVLSGGKVGTHEIQGIGAGFVPKVLDMKLVDRIITVSDEEAIDTARALSRQEGIMGGISSGAALFAGMKLANEIGRGKKIVVLLPDSSERYMSTALFRE